MNIAGSFLNSSKNDGIDQLDNRTILFGKLFNGNNVFFFPALLFHYLVNKTLSCFFEDLRSGFTAPQGFLHSPQAGRIDFHFSAEKSLNAVNSRQIRRIRHGYFQDPPIILERHKIIMIQKINRKRLNKFPIQFETSQVKIIYMIFFGQAPGFIFFRLQQPVNVTFGHSCLLFVTWLFSLC